MEDISDFLLERSTDYFFWEDISYQELLKQVLNNLDEDQAHLFCRVVRTGSPCKHNGYFYRIKCS